MGRENAAAMGFILRLGMVFRQSPVRPDYCHELFSACLYTHCETSAAGSGGEEREMVKIEGEYGVISISADVFTNIAGYAATNCFGVKGMAGRSRRDGIVQLLRRESMSKGVSVSFEDSGTVSVALHIVVDYGVNITALARSIMNEVSYKVSGATGVPVRQVDVFVESMIMN